MRKCICGFQAACCSTLATNYCSIQTARSSANHRCQLGSQICAYSLSKTARECNPGEGFPIPLECPCKQAKRKTADKISSIQIVLSAYTICSVVFRAATIITYRSPVFRAFSDGLPFSAAVPEITNTITHNCVTVNNF